MPSLALYFLTVASVSLVLAGICVTLRNFTYSTLIDPRSTGLSIGERDYPEILKKSGWWATIASLVFLSNTAICFVGLGLSSINPDVVDLGKTPTGIAFITGVLFLAGVVILTLATVRGFFQTHQPDSEERAPTEPMDGDG